MSDTFEVTAVAFDDDMGIYALQNPRGVICMCERKFARAARIMLTLDLTPVMASLTETGDVWSIYQA